MDVTFGPDRAARLRSVRPPSGCRPCVQGAAVGRPVRLLWAVVSHASVDTCVACVVVPGACVPFLRLDLGEGQPGTRPHCASLGGASPRVFRLGLRTSSFLRCAGLCPELPVPGEPQVLASEAEEQRARGRPREAGHKAADGAHGPRRALGCSEAAVARGAPGEQLLAELSPSPKTKGGLCHLSMLSSADGLGRPGSIWRTFQRDPKFGPDGCRRDAFPKLLLSQPAVLAM